MEFDFTIKSTRQITKFIDNNIVINSSVYPNVFSYSNEFECNLTDRLNRMNWLYYKQNNSFIILTKKILHSFDKNGVLKWEQEFQNAIPSTLTKVNDNLMAFLCNSPEKSSPENPDEGGPYFFIINAKGDIVLKYKCSRGISYFKLIDEKIIFEGNKLECIDFKGIQQWNFKDSTPYVGNITKLKNGNLIAGGYKCIYLISQTGDLLKKVIIKTHLDHLSHVYPVLIDEKSIGVLGRISELPIMDLNCEIIKKIDFNTNNDYVKNIFRMGNTIVIVFGHRIEIYKFE